MSATTNYDKLQCQIEDDITLVAPKVAGKKKDKSEKSEKKTEKDKPTKSTEPPKAHHSNSYTDFSTFISKKEEKEDNIPVPLSPEINAKPFAIINTSVTVYPESVDSYQDSIVHYSPLLILSS